MPGSPFLISHTNEHYIFQMISDISFRKEVHNGERYKFLLIAIPDDIEYHITINEILNHVSQFDIISRIQLFISFDGNNIIIANSSLGYCEMSIYSSDGKLYITHPFFKLGKNQLLEKI